MKGIWYRHYAGCRDLTFSLSGSTCVLRLHVVIVIRDKKTQEKVLTEGDRRRKARQAVVYRPGMGTRGCANTSKLKRFLMLKKFEFRLLRAFFLKAHTRMESKQYTDLPISKIIYPFSSLFFYLCLSALRKTSGNIMELGLFEIRAPIFQIWKSNIRFGDGALPQ